MLLAIHFEAFLDSLSKMGLGMLGIFVVTGIIVGCIYWLNWLFKKK